MLWCLRRRLSDIRCVMYAEGMPIEVQVFQDRDILMREIFPEERLAIGWARLYGERLKQQGWQEVPAGKTSNSKLQTPNSEPLT